MITFGMVQGRLTTPPAGQLQWFPQESWEKEFALGKSAGIQFIELIAERKFNQKNPIWSDSGVERIRQLSQENGMNLIAVCDDYIIENPLTSQEGELTGLAHNLKLIERARLLGAKKLILPLFEKGELTKNNATNFVAPLRTIADACAQSGMLVLLETGLIGEQLVEILDQIAKPNIKLVFDTGNHIALGQDIYRDIRFLKDLIQHVHIKDKNAANQNVRLGTGDVDFMKVFEALAEIKYQGPYTFETTRGNDPIRTARFNVGLVKYFAAEAGFDA